MTKRVYKHIPKLTLDSRAIMKKAENAGLLPVESEISSGLKYCFDSKNVLLLTDKRGYLMIKRKDFMELAKEMQSLSEVYEI